MKVLDLTASSLSEIPFKRWTFPDGQPHFELDFSDPRLSGPASLNLEWEHIQIITRLKSAQDFVDLGLAVNSVRSILRGRITVNISYMLGARMDRAIGPGQPFTLEVLAGILKAACAEANDIRILDPHSSVTLDLIPRSQAIHADSLVRKVLARMAGNPTIVIPDKGAIERTNSLLSRINAKNEVAQCSKVRDMATGKLSGFSLDKGDVNGKDCLIVDDICDGGWTFTGTAKVLREHGAKSVSLCVTHGIFSKGIDLDGVDMIYTTDSYYPWSSKEGDKFVGFENFLRDWVTGPK